MLLPAASMGMQSPQDLQVAKVGVRRGPGSWKPEAACSQGAWRREPCGSRPLAVPERSHGRWGRAAPPRPIPVTHPPPHPALALCPASSHPGPPAKPGQPESAGNRPGVVGVAGPDLWNSLPAGGRGEHNLAPCGLRSFSGSGEWGRGFSYFETGGVRMLVPEVLCLPP